MPIVGPYYEDESLQYSSQRTINMFPSIPTEGRTERALHWWPGTRSFSIGQVSGVDRGMIAMDGIGYHVVDQTLYSFDVAGAHTSLGTIEGFDRANLEEDGTNIVISTGLRRYQYNVTDGLTLFTDVDHQPGNTSTFINRQMVMDGNGGQFQTSDVDDPDNINGLNFATAESAPDDTIAVKAFDEIVSIFGTKTVEAWENTGQGNPPFAKIRGATKNVGLGAVHSIAVSDKHVYWLGSNKSVYRLVDIDFQDITPIAMQDFLKNNKVSDAYGQIIKFGRHQYYVLSFPFAGATWAIPLSDISAPFQLESGVLGERHAISSVIEVYGKTLVSDWRNSNIYEFDFDTYSNYGEIVNEQGLFVTSTPADFKTSAGEEFNVNVATKTQGMLRERVTSPINAEILGLPGRELTMNFVEFLIETGTGNPNDLDPIVILSASFDNGRSYTNEQEVKIGKAGGKPTVRLNLVRTFKDAQFKIRFTDNTKFSIHAAGIMAKLAGKR